MNEEFVCLIIQFRCCSVINCVPIIIIGDQYRVVHKHFLYSFLSSECRNDDDKKEEVEEEQKQEKPKIEVRKSKQGCALRSVLGSSKLIFEQI